MASDSPPGASRADRKLAETASLLQRRFCQLSVSSRAPFKALLGLSGGPLGPSRGIPRGLLEAKT
eukprot:7993457-Pyramimonas_sp.AAC.1